MTDRIQAVSGPERVDRREGERRERERRAQQAAAKALVPAPLTEAEAEAATGSSARPAVHTAGEPGAAARRARVLGPAVEGPAKLLDRSAKDLFDCLARPAQLVFALLDAETRRLLA